MTGAETGPGIVDAHHHVWDLSVRDQDWISGDELAPLQSDFTIADLAPEARAAGVTATVLVQTITVPEETPEFLALAADSDLVAGVVGWTDLTAPDVAETLAELRAGPGGEHLVGIRHQVQGEPDPRWLVRPEVLRGLAAVAEAGLVYDLVVKPHQLAAAVEAAQRLPGLTFVLDHIGKPHIASGELAPWAQQIRSLAALPNTVCKLSGMVTEADWDSWTVAALTPYADTVLDAFGPERLMFGSDWPVCRLAATYTEVIALARELTAGLGSAERHDVFAGTAVRTYDLPVTARPSPPQETPCA
ncbi:MULTISPECIES: amidohydrolase family protein [unclassified Streptomyces]|uniref:amidohydrolase family protein n=1 Tax=unclassified Streptomyces TaxID=2593676 RepID=UPI002366F6D4|nr:MULTISPECIES: amidohydrolase family protein [unclassified Streptomyces]MDF3144570.1 amidohydrolase family protein [Streptomyces sp. T21Q-yed]WDF36313.1 amidohydrolase family protein [Streptomyces sp. T12]